MTLLRILQERRDRLIALLRAWQFVVRRDRTRVGYARVEALRDLESVECLAFDADMWRLLELSRMASVCARRYDTALSLAEWYASRVAPKNGEGT